MFDLYTFSGKKSFFMIHPDQYHKLPMERLQYTGSNFCPEINQVSLNIAASINLTRR